MRVFVGSVFGFIAGAVVSYFALMVGYSVWIDLFKVHDQDGGGAMAMGLIIGPVVALICGIIAAIFCGVRVAQRS
jgi:hypothetical protein